jgi:hypothetical protein
LQGVFIFGEKMDSEKTTLSLTRRDETVTFHLRIISVAEDKEYLQRFAAIAEKKGQAKSDAEMDIYTDALASWSCEIPTRSNGDGKEQPVGSGTPAEAVKAYFKDRTAAKQWLAVTAVSAYRSDLYPSVSFK